MKSAYPSNYLLLMPKNKTSFTFTEQQKKKKSDERKKEKPMASSGPHTRGQWESQGEEGQQAVSHRWRRSAYVTCLVFLCPALNLCAKSLSRQLLNSQNVLFLLRVFLVSVLCRFLRQLSARLLHRLVPDKLCGSRRYLNRHEHTLTTFPVVILFSFRFYTIFYFLFFMFLLYFFYYFSTFSSFSQVPIIGQRRPCRIN